MARRRSVARVGYGLRWVGWFGLLLWGVQVLSGSEDTVAAKVGMICFIVLGGLGLVLESWGERSGRARRPRT